MKNYDQHHRFAKHKNRKKRYGVLIHDNKNLEIIDHGAHMEGKGNHLNERQFCAKLRILECVYCKKYFPDKYKPCVWFYGVYANDCRNFDFDLEKYKEVKK